MDALSNDEIHNPNFESVIHEFCKITSRKFNVFEIAQTIETLRQSNLLNYIIKTPTDHAIGCLTSIVHENQNIPQHFVGRFLAVIHAEINVMPNNLRIDNQSFVAKIVARRVVPPTSVTNFTVATMKQRLRKDISNMSIHSVSTPNVIPNEIKLQLNQKTLKLIVNSMSDLCSSIIEGNRAQGRHVDSYIRSQITYPG